MSKRMLIDGTHPEEVRVVVVDGNKLLEYDVETSTKRQIKGNIYLAKVTRVEPSLQAAFVDYGGNRHGFLAFSEIHPDYYQIPIEDRAALLAEQDESDRQGAAAQAHVDEIDGELTESVGHAAGAEFSQGDAGDGAAGALTEAHDHDDHDHDGHDHDGHDHDGHDHDDHDGHDHDDHHDDDHGGLDLAEGESPADAPELRAGEDDDTVSDDEGETAPGDETVTQAERTGTRDSGQRRKRRAHRQYKIQEVIKRRQILLVQVVKEERGNKGAALTTYISMAGRYCVLMPNSARGGGISRKITNPAARRKLKEIIGDLEIPDGMGVIMRTAGMERNKSEIKRDFEYLLRAWDNVRELTLSSTAPTLVYEEATLIKRAIRDLYTKDIVEILIEGTDAYQTAKRFMRLLMPSHAKRVQPYRVESIPLFHRYQVEANLDAMHSPTVQLRSGGYIVIHSTEALVAIDVNSGRATRERNIEETATKTNLEAAEEVGRQLRLRDLAGLVVIDFIDMEDQRNLRKVEKCLKNAMSTDRARIQLGRISSFGLLELSRQRLRPSLQEASTQMCPHCQGTGFIRSTESMALRVLRAIEEEGIRRRSSEVVVSIPTAVALYILNQKRQALVDIEARYGFTVVVEGDDTIISPDMRLERTRAKAPGEAGVVAISMERTAEESDFEDDVEDDDLDEDDEEAPAETAAQEPSKRRRRRRGKRSDDREVRAAEPPVADGAAAEEEEPSGEPVAARPDDEQGSARRRRRGRRGGRRRSRRGTDGAQDPHAQAIDATFAWAEPSPPELPEDAGDSGDGGDAGPDTHDGAISATFDWTKRIAASEDAPSGASEPASHAADTAPVETDRPEPARAPIVNALPDPIAEPEPAAPPEPRPAMTEPEHAEPEPVPAMAAASRDSVIEAPAPVEASGGLSSETVDADLANKSKRRGWWQRFVE